MQPHGLGRRHLWSDTDAQHSVASSRSANHGRLALVSGFLVRNLDSIDEELLGHLDAGEELLVAVVARLRDKAVMLLDISYAEFVAHGPVDNFSAGFR